MITVQGTSVYVSTLSLTAVAIDRYHTVSRAPLAPCQQQGELTSAVASILVLDTMALLPILPYTLHITWELDTDTGTEVCWEQWQGTHRQLYGVLIFLTQFTVPLMVSSLAYMMIINKLSLRRGAVRPGAGRSTIRYTIIHNNFFKINAEGDWKERGTEDGAAS